MFVELFLFFLPLLYVCLSWYTSKTRRMNKTFPGPKPYPIVGNIFEFTNYKGETSEALKKLSFEYGPVFRLRLGTENIVCLRDPADIESLLSHYDATLQKSPMYDELIPWVGIGLFICPGHLWKRERRLLTPAFHLKLLESFIPVFEKNSRRLAENLFQREDQEFDISKMTSLWQFDNIIETLMGLKADSKRNGKRYIEAMDEYTQIIVHRNFSVLQRTFLFPYLPSGRRHDYLVGYMRDFAAKILKERRLERSVPAVDHSDNGNGISKRKPLLDMLLDHQAEEGGLTDKYISEQIGTFLAAGLDTVGSAMAFTLYALSHHPEAQEKAFQEVNRIFGDSNRDATYQDLQDMKYLDNVIREAIRIYGTPYFARKINEDIPIKSGYTVPKNSTVIILMEAMHKDPNVYRDPLKFDPDRFDHQDSLPHTIILFGAGIRNCIGKKYAMMALKCGVSRVLRKIRLLASNVPLSLRYDIVLKSSTGIYMKIERRKHS